MRLTAIRTVLDEEFLQQAHLVENTMDAIEELGLVEAVITAAEKASEYHGATDYSDELIALDKSLATLRAGSFPHKEQP